MNCFVKILTGGGGHEYINVARIIAVRPRGRQAIVIMETRTVTAYESAEDIVAKIGGTA